MLKDIGGVKQRLHCIQLFAPHGMSEIKIQTVSSNLATVSNLRQQSLQTTSKGIEEKLKSHYNKRKSIQNKQRNNPTKPSLSPDTINHDPVDSSSGTSTDSSSTEDSHDEIVDHVEGRRGRNNNTNKTVKNLQGGNLRFAGNEKENSEEFLDRLVDFKNCMGVATRDLLASLPAILTQNASRWYRGNRNDFTIFTKFKQAFKPQFIGEFDREDLMEELRLRTQTKEEKISRYLSCFKYIISRFSDPPSLETQVELALRNLLPSYRKSTARKRLRTLGDIEKYGRRHEKELDLDARYVPPPPVEKSWIPTAAYTRQPIKSAKVAVAEENQQSGSKIKNQQGKTKTGDYVQATVIPSENKLNPEPQNPAPQRKEQSGYKPIQNDGLCYLCKEPGHRRAQCPSNCCFRCKAPGHRAKDCPLNTSYLQLSCQVCGASGVIFTNCPDCAALGFDSDYEEWREQVAAKKRWVLGSHTPRDDKCQDSGCENLDKEGADSGSTGFEDSSLWLLNSGDKEISVFSVFSSQEGGKAVVNTTDSREVASADRMPRRPFARISLEGKEYDTMIDSGAEISLAVPAVAEQFKDRLRPADTLLKGLFYTSEPLGVLDVSIELDGHVETLPLRVVDNIGHDIVLGIDFGEKWDVTVSLEKKHWKSFNSPWPRRMSPKMREIAIAELDKLAEEGVIERSQSDYSSTPVMIRKSDGSYRFCIDYRDLNKQTRCDAYQLPNMDAILDKLRKAKFLTKIDLKQAYYQIAIEENSKRYTAFSVAGKGLWQFKRMPFGLMNAPMTFQRLIDELFGPEFEPNVFRYLDDLIIVDGVFEEHVMHVETVLRILIEAGLTVNPEKCEFCCSQLRYLGFMLDRYGLRPCPEKVAPILEYPAPTTVKKLWRFLEMMGWYARFIPNDSELKVPLLKLLRKGQAWEWKEEQEQAFNELKNSLIKAPVLARPDFSKLFTVQCDASGLAIGAVLTQEHEDGEHPIVFVSRTLNPVEKNYSTTEKECLAMVWAIDKFPPYLKEYHFTVITDHSALKWLMALKEPAGRLARWAFKLQQWDFEIMHRKGASHHVPDALSRMYEGAEEIMVFEAIIDPWYVKKLAEVQLDPRKYTTWWAENGLLYKFKADKLLDPTTYRDDS
ncbi:uncharacterized protein LOC106639490 [Copidosoma floridanum]|uniref:uncharacterized protein LOC106639490 n=1 Tax=Copidosoma floridanum TaxID=29053 RepID=UPI0006C9913E|nr:uncharacterized protein LOC106639490 [Copidosoma floridanum]